LFPSSSNGSHKLNIRPKTVAVYRYEDEDGNLQYEVHRNDQTGFSQCRPDGKGGRIWNMEGVVLVPYRLPEFVAADPRQTIFACEGEKDCDRLQSLGILATCNSGGAGKWRNEFSRYLTGRRVVVITDNDAPGRDHAQKVAQSLHSVAESVRILKLPDLPEKGNVSDWLDAGGTKDGLLDLAKSASLWSPDPFVGFVSTPQGPSEISFSDLESLPNGIFPEESTQILIIQNRDDELLMFRENNADVS
jgi:hypothetical protein